MPHALRYMQREAIDAIFAYWQDETGNPLVDMATGLGKSVTIGSLTQEILTAYPTLRILMLVHVKALVAQNAALLQQVAELQAKTDLLEHKIDAIAEEAGLI